MIVALDVEYKDPRANVAVVGFKNWQDAEPVVQYRTQLDRVAPYVSGQFYQRELPCLQGALALLPKPLSVIIVDSHVWLDQHAKPGLGAYLFRALEEQIPVIGVAKRAFGPPHPLVRPVKRGGSENPLFVSSAGVSLDQAVAWVVAMHGPYRIPTLLKQVDQLSRQWPSD